MARAQDSSAWDAEPHAAARLIAGAALRSADAAWLRAGIEIRLDTGWKTYWRYRIPEIPAYRRRSISPAPRT
jgi:DsbC/DsbD-like thiol-disulfide interchange protein